MTRTASPIRAASVLLALALAQAASSAACSSEDVTRRPRDGAKRATTDPVTGQPVPDFNDPHTTEKEGLPDPLEGLPRGAQQNDALCARAGAMVDTNPNFNAVTSALCLERRNITSIKDLQLALGLDFKRTDAGGTNGSNNNPAFALLGHSTSLVARSVSAINPRAFVFSPPPGQPVRIPGYVAMAFTRGETFVEIAAESPKGGNKLTLYLLRFDLACGASCANGDLLTPATETNWKGFTFYDDEDLKNTLVDCRQCHQPDGPGQRMMLRMQELQDPWTHWFRIDSRQPGGVTLLQDYLRAHGDKEDYGGIPGALVVKADGRALEDLVSGQGFGIQPNEFVSKVIEGEIKASATAQPEVNTPRGRSATWSGLYARAAAGEFIPAPYHDVKVTDPNKLQFATDAYKKFIGGGGGELLDIRRVFLDEALEEMTFQPKAGASGREILVQTCAQCHNARLDPSISRAKFDVTRLEAMTRAEKDTAIQRLNLPASDRLKMPPAAFRTLPDDARAAAIAELKK